MFYYSYKENQYQLSHIFNNSSAHFEATSRETSAIFDNGYNHSLRGPEDVRKRDRQREIACREMTRQAKTDTKQQSQSSSARILNGKSHFYLVYKN